MSTIFERLSQAIKDIVHQKRRIVVNEEISLAAAATKQYSLATLLGADAADYNLKSHRVYVRIKDTDASSTTYNYFISAESTITTGVSAAGNVLLVNQYDSTLTVWVVIEVEHI